MVDTQLLRKLKTEKADLKSELTRLKDQNFHLWKVIKALNDLECDLQSYSTSSELVSLIMNILEMALDAVDSQNGSILLLDEETDELVFVAVVGDRQRELTGYRIPANSGVAGWVCTHREPALVQDVRTDDRWISAVDQSIGFHTQSLMAVPLVMSDRVLGVMEVVNALSEDHFDEKDLSLLRLIARMASFVFGCTEDALDNRIGPLPFDNYN